MPMDTGWAAPMLVPGAMAATWAAAVIKTPAEAARAGVEGEVKLRLLVDETGRVRSVTVLRDPGHGLGPAAARIARRYFRFRPARLGGEPVATEIPFTVLFELP